ncbi:MAG: hypothetical protein JWN38_904 [Candidatus Saccharibacteria bacterium]|nr:hypothetical protein [Candidatus Saccharibacteria bacterium]
MFGCSLLIVGKVPNTTVAAAINVLSTTDGPDAVNACKLVHVHGWAWLGDWIDRAEEYYEAFLDNGHRPPDRKGKIAGAEVADDFYLDLSILHHTDSEVVIDRELIAAYAADSLYENDPDELRFVYGIVMDDAMYAKRNSHLMLDAVSTAAQSADITFKARLVVANSDGTFDLSYY